MTTVTCDHCSCKLIVGYECEEKYLGFNGQERIRWSTQPQIKTDVVYVCARCMQGFLLGMKNDTQDESK